MSLNRGLDRNGAEPLHVQAARLLRDLVVGRHFPPGSLLPDEVSLARELGLSRNTLRTALARLEAEGLLERRPGAGTRVKAGTTTSGLGDWLSFSREMAAKGIQVQIFESSVRWEKAEPEIASALGLAPGTRVLRLDRLKGWHSIPAVHFRSFLHPRLGLDPSLDFQRPLYELIAARTGIEPAYADQEILAVQAEPWVAELLRLPAGAPVLLRRHVVYDGQDQAMEFSRDHLRSDRFTLSLRMRRV